MSKEKEAMYFSLVQCDICTHSWMAIMPIKTTQLECPNCHHMTSIEGGEQ